MNMVNMYASFCSPSDTIVVSCGALAQQGTQLYTAHTILQIEISLSLNRLLFRFSKYIETQQRWRM